MSFIVTFAALSAIVGLASSVESIVPLNKAQIGKLFTPQKRSIPAAAVIKNEESIIKELEKTVGKLVKENEVLREEVKEEEAEAEEKKSNEDWEDFFAETESKDKPEVEIDNASDELFGTEEKQCEKLLFPLAFSCALIGSKLRIALDVEGYKACMRHQVCYSCASELDVHDAACDNAFRDQAISICLAESYSSESKTVDTTVAVGCTTSGAAILDVMQSLHKRAFQSEECTNPCLGIISV